MLASLLSRRAFAIATMSARNVIGWHEMRDLKDDPNVLLVDVREPKEVDETGVIPGAINIPLSIVEEALKTFSAEAFQAKYHREKPQYDTPLVFTCRSGSRSVKAYDLAETLGYTNIRNYSGGWLDWQKHLET